MKESNTKDRILDSAEMLFAEKGLKHTSVRDITGEANAHLAAVNYHFGSKDGLVRDLVHKRVVPLKREQLRLLKEAEKKFGRNAVPVEEALHALLAPSIRLYFKRPHFLKITGQITSNPEQEIYKIYLLHFQEVFSEFKEVLRESLPHIGEEEIMWRIHFMMGGVTHIWNNHSGLEQLSGGLCRLDDEEETTKRLINFYAAGLKAPQFSRKELYNNENETRKEGLRT